jgi:phosphatidylinositol alpha-mannosyltransferase
VTGPGGSAGTPRRARDAPLRIGIVCPYSLDVPGGVQSHVLDLARALITLGHDVSVLAPADDERPTDALPLPAFVTPAGRAMSVPYNGSVARITFGPLSYARVRRWLGDHTFDVLHLHEPGTFSLSSLALFEAEGPIVATFHTSTERSRATLVFARPINVLMEKVTARIAVSPMARRVQVEHLGGDAVEIPNGVDVPLFAHGPLLPGYPHAGHTVGFLGRFGEPRKGMAVLLDALRLLAPDRPGLRLLVVGRGDADALRRAAGPGLADRLDVLGGVDDVTKAAALRSMDVYCAPNTGGESFGMVLTEALAAGAPVVASDLEAFRAVLRPDGGSDGPDGEAGAGRGTEVGVVFPTGDAPALAAALAALLDDPARRAALRVAGRARAAGFDWPVVASAVLRVYRAASAADPRRVPAWTAAVSP